MNNNINNIHNINISQPITNRANSNNNNLKIISKINKKDYNRNLKKNIFEDLNVSCNSHTIDSSRINNNNNNNINIIPTLNEKTFLNKHKIIEDKNKKNDLYQKSINGLAEEVMKPSFLKSDVSMTKLGGGININNNDSFLFLAKNKIKNKNNKNDNSSFVEQQNNNKRNISPFNNSNSKNKNNNSLHRNRSFLY